MATMSGISGFLPFTGDYCSAEGALVHDSARSLMVVFIAYAPPVRELMEISARARPKSTACSIRSLPVTTSEGGPNLRSDKLDGGGIDSSASAQRSALAHGVNRNLIYLNLGGRLEVSSTQLVRNPCPFIDANRSRSTKSVPSITRRHHRHKSAGSFQQRRHADGQPRIHTRDGRAGAHPLLLHHPRWQRRAHASYQAGGPSGYQREERLFRRQHPRARCKWRPTATVCGATTMDDSSVNIHYHGTNTPPTCHQDEVIHTLINSGEPSPTMWRFPRTSRPASTGTIPTFTGNAERADPGRRIRRDHRRWDRKRFSPRSPACRNEYS